MRRNLTITVDEAVARWARVRAAEKDISVSRLVGEMLKEKMQEERAYEAAMRLYLSRKPVMLKQRTGYPNRDELHDRPGLR